MIKKRSTRKQPNKLIPIYEDKDTPVELRDLSIIEEKFCHYYLVNRNGTDAAIKAGYSRKVAASEACILLRQHNIRLRINELIKKQLDKVDLKTSTIIRELMNSAMVNITDAYNEDGTIKPLHEMPESLQKAIISIETEEIYTGSGEERRAVGQARKIKIHDRVSSLKLLGQHLKMFTDVMQIENLDGLAEAIKRGRERAQKAKKTK